MIDRHVVLDCAEKAGFGGIARASMYPRLARFAEFLIAWHAAQNIALCTEIGDKHGKKETEFADGQMDGAYQCAEALARQNAQKS